MPVASRRLLGLLLLLLLPLLICLGLGPIVDRNFGGVPPSGTGDHSQSAGSRHPFLLLPLPERLRLLP
jgi:hypothetical protein